MPIEKNMAKVYSCMVTCTYPNSLNTYHLSTHTLFRNATSAYCTTVSCLQGEGHSRACVHNSMNRDKFPQPLTFHTSRKPAWSQARLAEQVSHYVHKQSDTLSTVKHTTFSQIPQAKWQITAHKYVNVQYQMISNRLLSIYLDKFHTSICWQNNCNVSPS